MIRKSIKIRKVNTPTRNDNFTIHKQKVHDHTQLGVYHIHLHTENVGISTYTLHVQALSTLTSHNYGQSPIRQTSTTILNPLLNVNLQSAIDNCISQSSVQCFFDMHQPNTMLKMCNRESLCQYIYNIVGGCTFNNILQFFLNLIGHPINIKQPKIP